MSGETVSIPRDRWKRHLRYVRRMRRKYRSRTLQLRELQDEVSAMRWFHRVLVWSILPIYRSQHGWN